MPTVDELRARVKPHGPWFDVPPGTPEADCARCDADGLYWGWTKNKKKILIDTAVAGGIVPSGDYRSQQWGKGVAHFATCPKAQEFKR